MNGNLRIPVTTIENFRYITSIEDDVERDKSLEEFEFGLANKIPPTRNMLVGSAFGDILQRPGVYYDRASHSYISNGYEFPFRSIQEAASVVDYRGLFEVSVEQDYDGVTVTGRIDHIAGNIISDFKTKLVDGGLTAYMETELFKKYAKSVQWMFYCDMLGTTNFRYVVYVFLDETLELFDINEYKLTFAQTHREQMQDALTALRRYLEFRGLEQYFTQRHAAPEGVTL